MHPLMVPIITFLSTIAFIALLVVIIITVGFTGWWLILAIILAGIGSLIFVVILLTFLEAMEGD